MSNKYYPASERGHVNFGWLDSHHSFSFGNWHDREKVQFGALRVLNDDVVVGGGGFDTHPHENMEIISIPLKGALSHKDSTGTEGLIYTNDVQIMSVPERSEGYDREGRGTTPREGLSGIVHYFYNASHYDAVNFLQIWIFPKHPGIKPRQDQRTFYPEGRKDQWQVVVSPRAEDHALWINQEARLALCHLSAGKQLTYTPAFPGNGIYIFLLEGSVEVDGHQLQPRDGIGITDTQTLTLTTNETSAELLAIEVPMFA